MFSKRGKACNVLGAVNGKLPAPLASFLVLELTGVEDLHSKCRPYRLILI
jgi:hypothetical protein